MSSVLANILVLEKQMDARICHFAGLTEEKVLTDVYPFGKYAGLLDEV